MPISTFIGVSSLRFQHSIVFGAVSISGVIPHQKVWAIRVGAESERCKRSDRRKSLFDVNQVQKIDRTWIYWLSAGTFVAGAEHVAIQPFLLHVCGEREKVSFYYMWSHN